MRNEKLNKEEILNEKRRMENAIDSKLIDINSRYNSDQYVPNYFSMEVRFSSLQNR